MRTLDPDPGSTTVEALNVIFPNGNNSVRQDRLHNFWNLPMEFSSPSPLNGAIVSNVKKQWQLAHLQRAVEI